MGRGEIKEMNGKKEKVKDLDRKSGFLRKSWAVRKGQIPVRSKNSRAEGRSLEGGKGRG